MSRNRRDPRDDAAPVRRNADSRPEPVSLGDLRNAGFPLSVHCRSCGHWSVVSADRLALAGTMPVPALEGRFRCGRCGSRDSCVMPFYPRKAPC